MTYLMIRTEVAPAAPAAHRVDFARFAGLFAEAEEAPPVPPRRGAARPVVSRLLTAPLLLAAIAANLALIVRPSAPATEPLAGACRTCAAMPS